MNDKISCKRSDMELVDHTVLHKRYNVRESALRLIAIIPKEDLQGLSKIHMYDESSPGEHTGKYSPPGLRGRDAEIDVYLNQTLGHMALVSGSNSHLQTLRNRIFLSTFGAIFLAETLYHEIGHHKFMTVTPKEYRTSTEQEQDAKMYADHFLRIAFPFSFLCYPLTNMIYRLLFRKFIRKSNQFVQSKTITDSGYFRAAGNMHLDNQQYEKAAEAFRRAIEGDAADCYAYLGKGVAMHRLGKYDVAIDDYTSGIQFCHNDPIPFYNRGLSHQALQQYQQAISDFTEAMELGYREKDVYLNRAFCYKELGNTEMASLDLQAVGKGTLGGPPLK